MSRHLGWLIASALLAGCGTSSQASLDTVAADAVAANAAAATQTAQVVGAPPIVAPVAEPTVVTPPVAEPPMAEPPVVAPPQGGGGGGGAPMAFLTPSYYLSEMARILKGRSDVAFAIQNRSDDERVRTYAMQVDAGQAAMLVDLETTASGLRVPLPAVGSTESILALGTLAERRGAAMDEVYVRYEQSELAAADALTEQAMGLTNGPVSALAKDLAGSLDDAMKELETLAKQVDLD